MYFFDNEVNVEKLRNECRSWDKTPYRHWSGVKGLGADCIHFVVRAYENVGAIPKIQIPPYPRDYHQHNVDSLLMHYIEKLLSVDKVDPYEPVNGDLICAKYGESSGHSAIFLDNFFWQAINGVGVERCPYRDKRWYPKLIIGYRIKA